MLPGPPHGAAGAPANRAAAVNSVPAPHRVHTRSGPLPRARSKLVELETAPFPYAGLVPRTNKPFLDVAENGRRGHRTGAGRIYWEDKTARCSCTCRRASTSAGRAC
jgi:hypothetical protein